MAGAIRRLKRREIDDEQWNNRLTTAHNTRIYGLNWWLDIVTGGEWEALIIDDYRVVLPLPFLRRFGVLRLLQRPPFTQQLGPFGELREGELVALLDQIPRTLRFSLPLVAGTRVPENWQEAKVTSRTNLVLKLDAPYPELEHRFSKNLRRHVRRGGSETLATISSEQFVSVYRQNLAKKTGFRNRHYRTMRALIEACQQRGYGDCYRFDDPDGLLCIGFFPRFAGRTYNLCAASTPLGMEREGMARFLARIIERDCGPGSSLDFEGSDLPGVKAFFQKFRPENEPYLQLS